MGKNKNKDEIPNPNSVTNRDILQRLNFLYQASILLNGLTAPPNPPEPSSNSPSSSSGPSSSALNQPQDTQGNVSHPSKKTKKTKRGRRVVSVSELSRSYVVTMKVVGQKTNVKMDPSVKRRICKACSSVLIPGVSATVRVHASPSHGHLISYRCHCCHTERRIPAPPVLHHQSPPPDKPDTDAMDTVTDVEGVGSSSMPGSTDGGPMRSRREKRKKGQPVPRLPPHFARDIGHVVFRGNERLT